MNFLLTLDHVLKLSRCFGFSTRSLGHVVFSFVGTAQELVVDWGQLESLFAVSLMGRFSLCVRVPLIR